MITLADTLYIVPTAQAGRRVRQSLARQYGALLPPKVMTPPQLFAEDDDTCASRAEQLLAMQEAIGPDAELPLAARYLDLRNLLGANALEFRDVVTEVPEFDTERWQYLAQLEERYYAALERRGKVDVIVRRKAMLENPPRFEGITKIVIDRVGDMLPASRRLLERLGLPIEERKLAASPVPVAPLICPAATAASEAEAIADFFAAVKPNEAYPALCVADPEMFPELVSAMRVRGLKIHNPSATRLVTSSLGQLASQLVSLQRTGSYAVFSAFVRGGDVRRWLGQELELSVKEYAAALVDLDNRQAELLPEKIDDIAPKTEKCLRRIFEFVKVQLRKRSIRDLLRIIFTSVTLDERDETSREFAAAAETLNGLLDECGDNMELLEFRLLEATYSLEPDEGEVIMTDGWMELPFVEASEVVIAGFREGCVPESVFGHPFLPDSIRAKLGLPDNQSRYERDRAIYESLTDSRAPGAVRIYFHSVDSQGDVLKPSRLLFERTSDQELFKRVRSLYGQRAGTPQSLASDLPEAWKLQLPIPPAHCELTKISPTRLDSYLRCPFTYYLRDKEILGDKRMDDRAEELQSWEYGNLAHEALEAWGLSELRDSTDEATIAQFLAERVDAQLADRFGLEVPAIVAMQGESVKRRLFNFAAVQAERRQAGWRIRAVERKLELQYGHTRFHGKCDRIDFNEHTGQWCVIDYKTWDSIDNKSLCYDARKQQWLSLQLPIYCAMLDADSEGEFAAAKGDLITSAYCVLGKTRKEVGFTEPMNWALAVTAEQTIRALIPRIERGIFWPPSDKKEWTYDYSDWLSPIPEKSVSSEWIADQERRLEEFSENSL